MAALMKGKAAWCFVSVVVQVPIVVDRLRSSSYKRRDVVARCLPTTPWAKHCLDTQVARLQVRSFDDDKMTSRASFQSPAPFSAQPMASTSSLVTPTLALLADPPVRQIDAAAMDYLLIEMVHTLRESEAVASDRLKKAEEEMVRAGFLPPTVAAREKQRKEKEKREKEKLRESTGSGASTPANGTGAGAGKGVIEDDAAEEGLRTRLEAIGVHVGGNIAERCVQNYNFTIISSCGTLNDTNNLYQIM